MPVLPEWQAALADLTNFVTGRGGRERGPVPGPDPNFANYFFSRKIAGCPG